MYVLCIIVLSFGAAIALHRLSYLLSIKRAVIQYMVHQQHFPPACRHPLYLQLDV